MSINNIIQFVKFGLVGASNTLLSLAIYYILLYFRFDYLIANIFGYIISSFWGYIINKFWVFKEVHVSVKKSVYRYYVVYLFAFLINIVLMYFQIEILGISNLLAPIFVLFITVPFNFILSKFWVYRKKGE